jgi:NAD dependent epimerase/dehydratase family enzyme
VTNAEFTKTLAAVLRRPAILAVPRIGLAALLGGEMAEEMLLGGQRVIPRKLLDHGYRFAQPDLEPALRHLLGR